MQAYKGIANINRTGAQAAAYSRLTKDDEPIDMALKYMRDVLQGKKQSPDGREKGSLGRF